MSYHTEKTLSSIRSLTDEWSIRKEGGKQSFFVLKEIDKLLADTPVDDVVSSKDVADKKNEVTMLRLERDEMLIRRQHAERQSALDDTSPIERSVIGNLRSINTRQHTQIREHCETIGALGATIRELEKRDALKTTAIDVLQADLKASHTNNAALSKALEEANTALYNAKKAVDGLEAELSNSKSAIMMKNGVINDRVEHLERVYNQLHGFQDDVYEKNKTIDELTETTRKLKGRLSSMYAANSDQDTTINKLHALLADEKMTLAAYRSNPLSDQVADRDNRIEQLMVLNEALRVDIELAHNLSRDHIAGQDRFIEELKSQMAGARIIIDNQATSIEELNDMYCDAGDKLERIEKIIDDCSVCTPKQTTFFKIIKIIQEG